MYFVPAKICESCCESFIFWAIWTCKLVCLPGVILEKDQETWLLPCNFPWFWDAYYLPRPCYLEHSFVAWHLYRELVFEVFGYDGGSVGTWSSVLRARKIVFLWFLILSRDQSLSHIKCKNDIWNWAQKVCGRCWCFWYCCRQTPLLVKAVPNYFAQNWQWLEDNLP